MAKRKEPDDFAETVVLPDGMVPTVQHGERGTRTIRDLERALESRQPAARAQAVDDVLDAPLDDACNPSAAEAHARYDEYLRYLDEIPVLSDVVSEPPRARMRDFRRGERPDARRHGREDPHTVRELHACELEERYREYAEALASPHGAGKRSGPCAPDQSAAKQ